MSEHIKTVYDNAIHFLFYNKTNIKEPLKLVIKDKY